MRSTDLAEEIDIEEAIRLTVDQLASLRRDVGSREPSIRELAAAALFLANFYNGIENVLKRICHFNQVEIPIGGDWHLELATSFGDSPRQGLPRLLDAQLANDLAPYRQFRHVVHHGYGFRLRWSDMLPGVDATSSVFARFQGEVKRYLRDIADEPEQ